MATEHGSESKPELNCQFIDEKSEGVDNILRKSLRDKSVSYSLSGKQSVNLSGLNWRNNYEREIWEVIGELKK